MAEGDWKIRNCWEGSGHEIFRRSCIAVRMSWRTAETVTWSSKTQVIIYGSVGKHWVPSGMSHRVVWYFGRPVNFLEESTTSISGSLRLWRLKRNINSKRQYPPVRVQDFKTNEPLLGPSTLQYEGTAFLRNVEKNRTSAAGGNVSCGLRYQVVLSCWWINELPSGHCIQYHHLLLYAEWDTDRLNAVAGKLMGEKGHTPPAQRTALPRCTPKQSLWTLLLQPAAHAASARCSCSIQTDRAYLLYPLIRGGHSDLKDRCDPTLVNDANKYGGTWRSSVNGARLQQIQKYMH